MPDGSQFFPITAFDNYEVLKYEPGDVVVKTTVTEVSLNPYGKAHGGYLYSLCDAVSGRVFFSAGIPTVTLQANINYIHGAQLHDTLTISGRSVHTGGHTGVAEIEIRNQDDQLICQAQFTMYVINLKQSQ